MLPISFHGTHLFRADDMDHMTASDLVCSPMSAKENGDEFAMRCTQSRSGEGQMQHVLPYSFTLE